MYVSEIGRVIMTVREVVDMEAPLWKHLDS
jgi:hypothetical protein